MEGLDVTQHGEEAYIHDAGFATAARTDVPQDVPAMVGATVPSL